MRGSPLEILREIPDRRRAGLQLRYAPSYTGLRGILQGVDPAALEAAFRAHAATIAPPATIDRPIAIAVDGETLRGSFNAFSDRKAAQLLSALRQADQIVLAHVLVDDKSNEIPAAPELDRVPRRGVGSAV